LSLLLEPPVATSPIAILDWAEMYCVATGTDDLSAAEILSEYATGARPQIADVESALALAAGRSDKKPSVYPFLQNGDRLLRNASVDECLYVFLRFCAWDLAPWRQYELPGPGPIFERVSRAAALQEMGPRGKSHLFGWPPRDGRATTFPQAVADLAATLGLQTLLTPPTAPNDHGVDSVVWAPFDDPNPAFPLTLVSSGVDLDYLKKADDIIQVTDWKEWIAFGRGPTITFATPAAVTRSQDWERLKNRADHVHDRNRILELLGKSTDTHPSTDWYDLALTFNLEQIGILENPPSVPSKVVRKRKPKKLP